MVWVNESILSNGIDILWQQLNAKSPRAAFDMDQGYLGSGYLAACMMELDDNYPWQDCLEYHVNQIFLSLTRESYPHSGLLGGLAGFTHLLRHLHCLDGSYSRACNKLEARLVTHLENQCLEIKRGTGVDRYTYDYAIGLCGILYHFACFPKDDQVTQTAIREALKLVDAICDSDDMWDLCTPPRFIPDDILRSYPPTMFGILDLGQAHGVTGLLGTLLAYKNDNLESAISRVLKLIVQSVCESESPTMPYYLLNSRVIQSTSGDLICGPPARNGWCYGIPMVEALLKSYTVETNSDLEDCFLSVNNRNPKIGQFDNAGICHGIAGRQAISYIVDQDIDADWVQLAERYLSNLNKKNWGFWDEVGGLLVVNTAIAHNKPMPRFLSLLGIGLLS